MSLTVDQSSPANLSEGVLRNLHDLRVDCDQEGNPAGPPTSFARFKEQLFNQPSFVSHTLWLAQCDGSLVGFAVLETQDRPDNKNIAEWSLYARRDDRMNIGKALLRPLAARALEVGRPSLVLDELDRGAAHEVAEATGSTIRYVAMRSRLDLQEVDSAAIETWMATADTSTYELISWENRCPSELRGAFVHLRHVMNTAPMGELEMEPETFTQSILGQEEQAMARIDGVRSWVIAARERDTGELAGYTWAIHYPSQPELIFQEDTGVDPKHRHRGIGGWVKATMVENFRSLPGACFVDTWNEVGNNSMRAINTAMGFRPLVRYNMWQADAREVLQRAD